MGWLLIVAHSLQAIGTLIIAFVVLSTHSKIKEDRKIDNAVVDKMNQEMWAVIAGIIIFCMGWVLFTVDAVMCIYTGHRQRTLQHQALKAMGHHPVEKVY